MTQSQINSIMQSPCTSFWLKAAMEKLQQRDLLDALRDAELLAEIMRSVAKTHGIK